MRTGLRGSLPLRSVGGLQHHCVILWAVSILITKAYIAASCHGVIRRYVGDRRLVLDPRVSFCLLALTEKSLSLSHATSLDLCS